jgi:hypothetical protein
MSDAQITFRTLDPSHDTDGRIASVGHALSIETVAIIVSVVIVFVFAEIVTVAVVIAYVLRRDVSACVIGKTKFGGAEISIFLTLRIFTASLTRMSVSAVIRFGRIGARRVTLMILACVTDWAV